MNVSQALEYERQPFIPMFIYGDHGAMESERQKGEEALKVLERITMFIIRLSQIYFIKTAGNISNHILNGIISIVFSLLFMFLSMN